MTSLPFLKLTNIYTEGLSCQLPRSSILMNLLRIGKKMKRTPYYFVNTLVCRINTLQLSKRRTSGGGEEVSKELNLGHREITLGQPHGQTMLPAMKKNFTKVVNV